MKSNMGAFDGWFRTLLFILSLCYAIMVPSVFAWILVGVGAVLFIEAAMMWCAFYALFGINTNPETKGH